MAWWWMQPTPAAPAESAASAEGRARPSRAAAYVDSQRCLGCHADQGRQWQHSHPAQPMSGASAATVRGAFDNAEFRHQGVTSRFFKRAERFFVRTDVFFFKQKTAYEVHR